MYVYAHVCICSCAYLFVICSNVLHIMRHSGWRAIFTYPLSRGRCVQGVGVVHTVLISVGGVVGMYIYVCYIG